MSPPTPAEARPGVVPVPYGEMEGWHDRMAGPAGIICDPDGQASSMRVAFLFCVFVVGIVWAALSLRLGLMLDIPWTVVVALSAMAGGKLIQRFAEGKR